MADLQATVSAAHRMRSGALSIGAHELALVAGRLENAARSGDLADCRAALDPLARVVERVEEEVVT